MMQIKKRKIILYFLYAFLFLLPWQTRYIYNIRYFGNGTFWDYGSSSLYATELILWVVILGVGLPIIFSREKWLKIYLQFYRVGAQYIVPLLVMLGTIILGFYYLFSSAFPDILYNTIFRVLEGLCLVFALQQLALNTSESRRTLYAFWLSGVVQGLLAIYQFFEQNVFAEKWLGLAAHSGRDLGAAVIETGTGDQAERWLRAYGSLGGPNPLGIFLAIIFIIGFVLFLQESSKRAGRLILLGQIAVTAGLVLSFSRGAWLAAGIGLATLFYYAKKNNLASKIFSPLASTFTVAFILFCLLSPLFTARINSIGRLEERSIGDRITQYQSWGRLIRQSPQNLLIGVGPGLYTLALWQINPSQGAWFYEPVHNGYLLSFAEVGLLGIILLFYLQYNFIKKIKQEKSIFLAVIVTLLVGAFFEHFLWSLYVGQLIWWTVWGLGLCVANKE